MIILEEVCRTFNKKGEDKEPYSKLSETMSDVLRSSIKSYFKENETKYTKNTYF